MSEEDKSSDSTSDLKDYIAAARERGSIKIDATDGEVFLVAPRHRSAISLNAFDGAEPLLDLPLARAAYSDRVAWLAATLSELAYQPFESDQSARAVLVTELARANLALVDTFQSSETGTEGFVAHRPGEYCVLVFRGTEKNKKDIITDLNARFYETPSGRAHRGFVVAYESVRDHVVAALERVQSQDPACQIIIAGHSLGGALGTCAAADLEKRFLIAACYTFGSPRVGVPEWSDSLKTPVYRIVNGADGVPLVPGGAVSEWLINLLPGFPILGWLKAHLKSGFVGFQHAGYLHFVVGGKAGAPHFKIGSAATWSRLKHITYGKIVSAIRAMSPKALSALFADHSIREYRRKLKAVAEYRNEVSGPREK